MYRVTLTQGGDVRHWYRPSHCLAEEFAQEIFRHKRSNDRVFVMLRCSKCLEWCGASVSCELC